MKRNAIARIIIYSLLTVILTSALMVGLFSGGLIFNIGFEGGTTVEDSLLIDAQKIKNIEIDWAAGSVEIWAADTDQIHISEILPDDCKYKMTFQITGDTLMLNYSKSTVTIGFGNWNIPSKDLIIMVPQDWLCEELQIDGASLDIDLQNLTIQKLNLDGASCNIAFTGSVDQVEIDGASTDITLNCQNNVSSIEIDGASCSLGVTLPKDCGFQLQMDGLSCKLHTDLSGVTADGTTVYGNGHCKIEVNGLSCDVTISESECAHQWGSGMPAVDIVTGESNIIYTCLLCGESSTTGNTFQPKRPTE